MRKFYKFFIFVPVVVQYLDKEKNNKKNFKEENTLKNLNYYCLPEFF